MAFSKSVGPLLVALWKTKWLIPVVAVALLLLLFQMAPSVKHRRSSAAVFEYEVQQHSGRPWPNRTVFYKLSEEYTETQKGVIRRLMDEFESKICVRFVPVDDVVGAANYASIMPGHHCLPPIGFVPGVLPFILSQDLDHCFHREMILRTLFHLIGFFHEHSRPDRNEYVTVFYRNIREESLYNYKIWRPILSNWTGLPYDYQSITHHGPFASTKNGLQTIRAKHRDIPVGSQQIGLTELDVAKGRRLYQCDRAVFDPPFHCVDHKNGCGMSECAGGKERHCLRTCGVC